MLQATNCHAGFTVRILTQDKDAWNVDGSSGAKPPAEFNESSWMHFWKCVTNQVDGARFCAYKGCANRPQHGGHVWIPGHTFKYTKVCWVVPICKECNDCNNKSRRQSFYPNKNSKLRAGSYVVMVNFTSNMENAKRRFH